MEGSSYRPKFLLNLNNTLTRNADIKKKNIYVYILFSCHFFDLGHCYTCSEQVNEITYHRDIGRYGFIKILLS